MTRLLHHLLLSFVLILSSVTTGLWAQQLDSKGTDFWLAFPQNIDFGSGNEVFFSISGDVASTGMWEIPGLGISDTFSVTPGTVTNVPIPNSAQVTSTDGVEDRGIHITSSAEVTVYGVNIRNASTDAYLGLPTDILGTEYVVLGYQGNVFPSQMAIVGTEDATTVTVTPSFTSGGRVQGVPYIINLDKGDVYQMQAGGVANDVSGTLIVSDKKVAVYGGNRCVNVPTGFGACDYIVEQIPPASTLGRQFVALPIFGKQGSTFRVAATEDTTVVLKDGAVVANLDAGEFYEVIDSTEVIFEATKPVLVAQYCHGQSWDGVPSDPFMMLIPPYEQFLGSYTVSTPSNARLTDHYLNIVAPNAAVGGVLLDGVLIPAGDFSPIGASGFSGTTKNVALGTHVVSSTSPVGVHSYGFGSFDSYGYPGGQSLAEVASADSLSLSLATGIAPQGDTVCVIQASVLDSANQPLAGVRVDFNLTGVNAQTGFAFTDSMGVATYCYYAANDGWDTVRAVTGSLNASGTVRILPCSLSLSASVVDILNGNPGAINLTVSGNVNSPTFMWSGPNGFSANTEDVNVSDSGTYKVVVTDPFFTNCKDSLEIYVAERITACTLNLSATQQNIVNGAPGSIDLSITGAVGTPSIMWTGPNGFMSMMEDPVVTDTGTYKVVVTDPGLANCADSLEVVIIAVEAGDCRLICISDSNWMQSTVVDPGRWGDWHGSPGLPGAATYSMMAQVGQPYGNNRTYVRLVPGTLPIKAANNVRYFRKTFNLADSADLAVRVRMFMDDDAEVYINGHLLCREENIDPQNFKGAYHDIFYPVGGAPMNGYMGGQMFDYVPPAIDMNNILRNGTNVLEIALRNLKNAPNQGGFSMRLDIGDCEDSVLVEKNALFAEEGIADLQLYPNPTNGWVTVALPEIVGGGDHELMLYDMKGKLLDHQVIESHMGGDFADINLETYAAGIYILRVRSGDQYVMEKISKQ